MSEADFWMSSLSGSWVCLEVISPKQWVTSQQVGPASPLGQAETRVFSVTVTEELHMLFDENVFNFLKWTSYAM